MASQNDSDLSSVILDLDDPSNIGHPCWEYLDRNPNIRKLFNTFNNLFFDRILCNRVDLKWCTSMSRRIAGETHPPSINKKDDIRILLNPNLLEKRLRRENIEQLLHEMIHAYLMVTGMDDERADNGYHGENFIKKMSEINTKARINITAYHEFPNYSRKSKSSIEDIDKRYMWRCRGKCRNMPPYFGFIWVNENREPRPYDLMWIDSSICGQHEFERINGLDDPKEWLTEWKCITDFNEFVAQQKIQVKSKQFYLADFNDNPPFSMLFNTDVLDEMYENYDEKMDGFISTDNFIPDLNNNSPEVNRTLCMICFCTDWPEDSIIKHLNACSGLDFALSYGKTLPILKIKNK